MCRQRSDWQQRRWRRAALILIALIGPALRAVTAAPPARAQPAPAGDGTPPVGVTVRFEYTGAPQSWTVPAGVTEAYFDVSGVQGGFSSPSVFGNQPGGRGGRAVATLPVTPGSAVNIFVGGKGGDQIEGFLNCNQSPDGGPGGFNGGGHGGANLGRNQCGGPGGGGGSDVRIGGTDLAHRKLVAGGGGAGKVLFYVVPGDGGGLTGGSAQGPGGGAGGNQDGTSGSGRLGFGGDGETDGYAIGGGGGGGGSGFGPAGTVFQTGVRSGHGVILVTYRAPPPTVTGISPAAGPVTGGTVVTITGTDLANPPGAMLVTFGMTPATNVSCQSATRCTATSPPGRGSVDMRVITGGQQSADTPADARRAAGGGGRPTCHRVRAAPDLPRPGAHLRRHRSARARPGATARR